MLNAASTTVKAWLIKPRMIDSRTEDASKAVGNRREAIARFCKIASSLAAQMLPALKGSCSHHFLKGAKSSVSSMGFFFFFRLAKVGMLALHGAGFA